jgi:hypothetical protein
MSVQTTTIFNGSATFNGPAAFGSKASAQQAVPSMTGPSA